MEYWSFGVLECWQKRKPEFSLHCSFHYSITPPLQQTAARGKDYGSPLRGQCKAGSFGSGFFTADFELRNWEPARRVGVRRTIADLRCEMREGIEPKTDGREQLAAGSEDEATNTRNEGLIAEGATRPPRLKAKPMAGRRGETARWRRGEKVKSFKGFYRHFAIRNSKYPLSHYSTTPILHLLTDSTQQFLGHWSCR